jgi:adenine-specific DNA-methyltransferase
MEKITKHHPLSKSEDILQSNIETLKSLFPTIVKEGKIDLKELEALLSDEIETSDEYYRFNWAGKSDARREANKPSTATLRPVKEESKNWDTTQNIFIEGDNLEVLKLLQKSYANQVKMIYIDPPYNTGKDFVYRDNYADNLGNYLALTGQTDLEGKRNSTNSESDGRYHSNWLNMMYPRLKLARNILKDDGVIFISIDDNEVNNLKKICDEIFGEENFLVNIIWQHSIQPKGYSGKFSIHHNYTLCYQKSNNFELLSLDRTDEHNKSYSNPDNDIKGLWRSGDVRNALYRPNLIYNITTPSGKIIEPPKNGWRWSKETLNNKIETGEIIFSEDETRIIRKIYLSTLDGRTPESIWFGKDTGTTRDATEELKKLFNGVAPFDTPKPSTFIKRLIQLSCLSQDDEIILDFFAGSGTTADSVMQMNAEDFGNRKFICVQLPEPINNLVKPDGDYNTIADITKERIKRSGSKIESELGKIINDKSSKKSNELNLDDEISEYTEEQLLNNLDSGFKVFKLDTSNINSWDGSVENFESNLSKTESNIKIERTEEDVLFEILIKYGLNLTVPISEKTINNCNVYNVGYGALFVCLSIDITTSVAEEIGKWKDELNPTSCRVIFRDNGFANDMAKTNSIQILKRFGINEINSI